MAKSTKKIPKKANQASPLKISTSLFQRNSRNSTGSRSSMSSLPASATKKAAAKLAAAARESKSKAAEKGKGSATKVGKKGSAAGAAASSKKNPPAPSKKTTKTQQQNESKSDGKSKRTLSNASTASSTTKSAKVKVEVVKAKTPSKPAPGKRGTAKKDEVKVVKAKAVERTSSTASSTISSRRTSTNASRSPPPPKTRSNNKDSKEKSSTLSSNSSTKKKETPSTRSPSRSPSPRLRNQSTSNNNSNHNVHTRTRSQSGSSSFPSSPISSTSSSSSSGNTSSSSSSSPPAQRKKKMTKKKVTTTKVVPKKVASKVTKKVIKKEEKAKKDSSEKKSTKKVELPPRKKTRSSSGDSSKSLRTIGGARRIIRSPSSPSSSPKLTSTKNSSSKKPDRVMAKKITKKAIKANKPKPKPILKKRPKSKKRMASLNAKAILEASFKEEDKKVKATPSPKISKHSAPTSESAQQSTSSTQQSDKSNEIIPKEISDIKNLLRDVKIEIRSGPPVNYKEKSPEKIERKRKSSGPSCPPENNNSSGSSNNKDVESSRRSSPPRRSIDSKSKSTSSEKGAQAGGSKSSGTQHSGRISSPVPKKKTKVATAETSTSTPAWNWDPNLAVYPQQQPQRQSVSYGTSTYEPPQYNLTGRQESLASRTDYGSKSQGCQAKADSPAIVAGRTVYQPAGPLIEPHKTPSSNTAIPSAASVGGGYIHIPESVRLPPDLKVTYQTHPPSSLPPPVQSKQSNRSSSSSGTSKSGSSKGGGILHQPYKTSSASTSSSSTSTNTVSTGTQRSSTQRQSLLPSATTSTLIEGNNAGAFGALQQPLGGSGGSSIGTHTAMTAAAVTAMGGSGAAHMYYPGYAGQHHSSPFAPSKFPIVPPDSFRAHSPYPPSFLYAPPQAGGSTPQNFYMTPFYTPPMTPTSAPILGSVAGNVGQPRQPILAPPPHHPHASPALAAASAIYQSNHHQLQSSSSADQSASYYVTPPTAPLQAPSHHSIPSQSSPGHAGLFPPNQSSPPACPCPTDSYPQRSSTITTSNSNSIISNSKPPLQQRLPQQTSVTPGTHSDHRPEALNKNLPPARRRAPKDLPPPPLPAPETPKTDAKAPKQQESVMKTFSEQYSLPDDITITPILVPHGTTAAPTAAKIPPAAVPKTAEVAKKPVQKPKDIVHVINPRSGATTTIAKHMSSSSAVAAAAAAATVPSPVKNVSPVKPNNAVTVGKIHPDLDVIVIAPGRCPVPPTSSTPVQAKGADSRVGPYVNVVQPEKRSDTEATQVVVPTKRKGIHECVDGLQKKRMKEVEAAAAAATAAAAQINGDRRRKSASPTAARAMPREQVFEMRNSTIVNEREAVVAASALVVPSNRSQIRLSPHKNGLRRGLGLKVPPGHTLASKYQNSKDSNAYKPVATRSSTANAKIKTRSSAKDGPVYTSRVISPEGGSSSNSKDKDRHRLLRRRVPTRRDQSQRNLGYPLTISTNGRMKSRSPYMASPSSASSSSSGGQVILRIPKVGLNYSDESGSSSHRHHRYYNDNPRSLLVPATALRGSGGSGDHHGRQYVDYAPALPHGRPFVVGESSGKYKAQIAGSMAFSAMKKRAIVKPLSPNVMNGALHSMMAMARRQPRWSNGWRFEGEPFEAKVYLTNDDTPVIRRCYPAMKHDGGDVIHPRDCVLLKSGPRKTDLPFVAKVAALWENPVDGEMMFSLLWYYRPEHTEFGRQPEDMPDEIFASKHRDCNSVATIEDRCFVLTLNEYCRYKKRLKQLEEGITAVAPIVPLMNSSQANINSAADIAQAVWNNLQQGDQRRVPPPGKVSPDVVFFCRKVYDFRQKRMLKNPT